MHPDLTIPLVGAEIKSYALFTELGALVFMATALPLMKRAGVKPLRALVLIAAMAAAFLAGARLWNVAVSPGSYGGSLKWYSLKLAGFSMYGGLLGAAFALLIWYWLNRAQSDRGQLPALLDAMVVPTALAFALARVGCYLNGCCSGVLTHSAWGVEFPLRSGAQRVFNSLLPISGIALPTKRYPTQMFELGLALLGVIPALAIGRWLKRGSKFLLYGAWFSAVRLAVLPLRSLPYDDIVTKAVYPALYIALMALGAATLILLNRRRQDNEKVWSI